MTEHRLKQMINKLENIKKEINHTILVVKKHVIVLVVLLKVV